MTFLFALASVWLASVGFLVIQFHRAPHGYQDEQGFHFAKAPVRRRNPVRAIATAGLRYHSMRLAHTSFVR